VIAVKFVERHSFADPDVAARNLIEIANSAEAVQDGRIYIERVNEPFLAAGGSGEQFRAGIERAIALGWLWRHESGTFVKFTDSGAALFIRAIVAGRAHLDGFPQRAFKCDPDAEATSLGSRHLGLGAFHRE
jgi:hypothetical protein